MRLADEVKAKRREIRKAATAVGFGSFIYTIIAAIFALVGEIYFTYSLGKQYAHCSTDELFNIFMNHPVVAIVSIVSSLFALLVIFLCFAKHGTHKQLFQKNQPITAKKLGCLLCIMYLFGSIGNACYQLIEQDLNLFGLSTATGLEMATGKSSTIEMFLYVSFIGPIVEELVFRGFLMRRMEKHGKLLAIIVSSLLFGLMHENLPQVLYATMVGLVLGYVAMEYSLVWSIILHVFNNLVWCDLLTRALESSSQLVQYLVEHSFIWTAGIIAIITLFRNRRSVLSWLRSNVCEKRVVIWVFTSAGIVIAVLYHIISTIMLISLG